MATKRGQGVLAKIWDNIFRRAKIDYRPTQTVGNDALGNVYYEQKADPSRGLRLPRRWYKAPNEDDWTKAMHPEWESWLRYRRETTPTPEEIARNDLSFQLKQSKGFGIKKKLTDLPKYKVYEGMEKKAGDHLKKDD